MRNPRLTITPREAAALDRLLHAYVGNDDADPGMDDLRSLQVKVGLVDQDHAVYDTALTKPAGHEPEGLRDPLGTQCANCGHPRNFHEYTDLRCTVKLDQHGFARCGCAYRSPTVDQAATKTRPYSEGGEA